MKTLYINPTTGDIELNGQNSFKMIEGDDELVQCVAMRFGANKGEWFLDRDFGLDRSVVQTKNYDEVMVSDALYETALQNERVASVEEITFDLDKENRKLNIDFQFAKEDGEIIGGSI